MQMQYKHFLLMCALPLCVAGAVCASVAKAAEIPTEEPLSDVNSTLPGFAMPVQCNPDAQPADEDYCGERTDAALAAEQDATQAANTPDATTEEDIADVDQIAIDLDNFVNETLQIIDVARIKRETAPPPLTIVQQRQKKLTDEGHPFTPEGFVNAAKEGEEKIVLRYLEADMSPNQKVSTGQTALHFAVIGNRLDIAQMLLSYKADPNVQNTRGDTPLHMAVERNLPYMVALLTTEGANPNQTNRDGWNALHLAAYNNFAEVAALLIEKGAKLDVQNRVGMTPLMLAIWKGHDKLAIYFIAQGANITPRDPQGNNAFLLAVTHNRPRLVELLLKNGADPNDMNGRGWSAIDIALESQLPKVANLLYAAGAKAPGLTRTRGRILNADR